MIRSLTLLLLVLLSGCDASKATTATFCARMEYCGIHSPTCVSDVADLPLQPASCRVCLLARSCEAHRHGIEHGGRGLCDYVCK